jgi:DNA mismatch repair protein MutS
MMSDLSSEEKVSPMMQQWHACKKQAGEALLLFRLGDFYEAFYADAVTLAKELELTLTKRQEIPMAGLPFHTSESYIDKLVGKGYHVAIAEQIEDPKQVKGLVKREIVRIITPGTLINSSLISEKSNNFIACLSELNHIFGLSVLDLTTAEFKVFEFEELCSLFDELVRLKPKELLLSERMLKHHKEKIEDLKSLFSFSLHVREDWHFEHQNAYHFLTQHFQVHSLDGFALKGMPAAINTAGALLSYVKDSLNASIDHIQSIQKETGAEYMCLDSTSLRHLEILEPMHEKQNQSTLLHLMDHTLTPMGARLLKFWLTHPLLSVEKIQARQDAVSFFLDCSFLESLQDSLKEIKDLERLIMKVETGFASPKDLLGLQMSLEEIPKIVSFLTAPTTALIDFLLNKCSDVSAITAKIRAAISDNPPFRLSDGGAIREGYSSELDELRKILGSDHDWIAEYQALLREETGIKTLKITFTRAFGYSIEVSRGQADKMPASFQRKQTLLNTERFITPKLKEYEHKLLSAEEKISSLESELFHALRKEVAGFGKQIRQIAAAIGEIDCLVSFAQTAKTYSYIRPTVDQSSCLEIERGRHPVIEAGLKTGSFIPNDTFLDDKDHRLFVITGPNMAGKSTFIRQVALIAILAQTGSFVPASKAHIGLLDKVFTRIGASDNLARGQSTFMVEMAETASILHNATDRSLVILDEIGRGTSTYDGISIAWAVAEYLLTTEGKQAKTLFATHYCELTELEGKIPGAVNYNVAVHESEKEIVFLRKIVRGGTDKSYGIHVARLAGLPHSLLSRAQELLKNLEKGGKKTSSPVKEPKKELQLSLFSSLSPQEESVLQQLKIADINQMTPLEALRKIAEWKQTIVT